MAIEWEGGIPEDERQRLQAQWAERDRLTREHAAAVKAREAKKAEQSAPSGITISAPSPVFKRKQG